MWKFLIIAFAIATLAYSLEDECNQDPVPENQTEMLGGSIFIKVDDKVMAMALNVSALWNTNYNKEASFFKVVCVHNAQSQVVSGAMYRINATIAETECQKDDMPAVGKLSQSDVDECELKSCGQEFTCVFKYWVQPWKNNYRLTGVDCDN